MSESFNASDLCKIIKSFGESGLSEMEYNGLYLKVSANPDVHIPPIRHLDEIKGEDLDSEKITDIDSKIMYTPEQLEHLEQLHLEELQVSDPEAWEHEMINKEMGLINEANGRRGTQQPVQ